MMRETGRRLLGIGARARFAAYSLFPVPEKYKIIYASSLSWLCPMLL